MFDVLHSITNIGAPFNMVVWIVLICTVGGIITAAIKQVRVYCSHQEEIALKQEMLDRGMSAAEISEVMRATSSINQAANDDE